MFTNIHDLCNILTMILAFFITIILGKYLIPVLTKLKYGQSILEIGPSWHKSKQGTPTMGGITFIIGIIISSCIFVFFHYFYASLNNFFVNNVMMTKVISGIIMSALFGIIGFSDDYIKIKNKSNMGLKAKQKILLQFLVTAGYLAAIYISETYYLGTANTWIEIPFFGRINFDLFYWPLCLLIITGIVNAVNLTDGVDGLCGCVSFIVGIGYMLIARILGYTEIGIQAAALIGGCIGFLFWNFHPAKVFMGDTGSLFLGGLICALGFGTGKIIILIILSMIYILEMFSVITQVIYFKLSKGKRLFKMSPIHHHFEIIGYKEPRICAIFTFSSIVFVAISILLIILGIL
ncbi:MAG: phospho-N-acetylmuramoyl-pentapeptide-transferase [Candidatus Improbicoccus devescovinae]|nr:MAG: phospho-N-acetylmuramoyl-pentapeptide-transferase [Candidatus Improbicoccus devescovinae]